MFRHGHELREFAMLELLDRPVAVADLRGMYRKVLDTIASHGFAAMIVRAAAETSVSPD